MAPVVITVERGKRRAWVEQADNVGGLAVARDVGRARKGADDNGHTRSLGRIEQRSEAFQEGFLHLGGGRWGQFER